MKYRNKQSVTVLSVNEMKTEDTDRRKYRNTKEVPEFISKRDEKFEMLIE